MAKRLCPECHGLGRFTCCAGTGFVDIPDTGEKAQLPKPAEMTFNLLAGNPTVVTTPTPPPAPRVTTIKSGQNAPNCIDCGGPTLPGGPSRKYPGFRCWYCAKSSCIEWTYTIATSSTP